MPRTKPRVRSGDLFLAAILLANFVFGIALLLWLRSDLASDLVTAEATIVSSKVDAYLWGKIVRFTETAGKDGFSRGTTTQSGEPGAPAVADDIPAGWNFQRIRSGTGEWLPVFIGTPRDTSNGTGVLPIGFLFSESRGRERFVYGGVSLGDLSGYLRDLKSRGIYCRIVDSGGSPLFGSDEGFPAGGATMPAGSVAKPLLSGGLVRDWSVQVRIPDAGSRLPVLPQAGLFGFFLLNGITLVVLRRKFLSPQVSALQSVTEVLVAQGELLPASPRPEYIAGAVLGLLSRSRREAEEESRVLEETSQRRIRDMADFQKNLMYHHRLTKKMLQCRKTEEVFDILLSGIVEGFGFQGTLLGTVSDDAHLVFRGESDPVSGTPLRVPLWHPGSLLARTFWSTATLQQDSPLDLPHLPEEEIILGKTPIFIFQVMKNIKVRCSETKNCGDHACPNYYSENMKCWLRQIPKDFFQPETEPEKHREAITACLRCEVFPASALFVIRSVPDGKTVTRENIVPLVNLASEAGLALEVVSLYDSMKVMAVTDGLTGLFNHREFYQALRRELERARRYRHSLSLLMIDVDDFKQFNDRFGHPAGDFALRSVADLLRKCARATDVIARYGGEEFAVILPESAPSGALMVAERIQSEVASNNFIPNAEDPVHLTVSIGIFTTENGEASEDQIVAYADEAAYTAKKGGKNRVVVKVPA
ncbi:MAG: hypothetical protein OHK0028_04970 [Deltaproteobacteria bacterium]